VGTAVGTAGVRAGGVTAAGAAVTAAAKAEPSGTI